MKPILVATPDKQALEAITNSLSVEYTIDHADSFFSSLSQFGKKQFEFLFIDLDFLDDSVGHQPAQSFLQPFLDLRPEADIIILTETSRIRESVKLVKSGACDYLTYPIDSAEVKFVIENIRKDIRQFAELKYLRNQTWNQESFIVQKSKSPAMRQVLDKIRIVAPTDSTVLLTGETGVGKGVIAEMIHRHSRRAEKQLIRVHCGAIPDTLLESELFGHEKGAFTGAVRKKLGKFEIAAGGTLFLDEIGTITPAMQIKLLQVLQDRCFVRVGGEIPIRSDARIIAASNADLEEMVDTKQFREDLFYRLNVFPLEIPPLLQRRDDIPILVESFLNKLNKYSLKNISSVETRVMDALRQYNWPGNIRELENLIERAYVLEKTATLTEVNFPVSLFHASIFKADIDPNISIEEVRRRAVEEVEKQYLIALLKRHSGRIDTSAEAAGIGVRQLHKLMHKYQLDKADFKK